MFEYLFWLFIFVVIPILVLLFLLGNKAKRYYKILIAVPIFSVIFSIFWDFLAVYLGVWYFPPDKNIGIIVLNFPFEEILFMILVSLFIALTTIVIMERK